MKKFGDLSNEAQAEIVTQIFQGAMIQHASSYIEKDEVIDWRDPATWEGTKPTDIVKCLDDAYFIRIKPDAAQVKADKIARKNWEIEKAEKLITKLHEELKALKDI